MKNSKLTKSIMAVVAVAALAHAAIGAEAEDIETRIGKLSFTHDFANGYPTDATLEVLFDAMDFQRACQAYLRFVQWGGPARAR